MSHIVKTLRVTPAEQRALRGAAAALSCELSRLFQEALTEAAHRLGFYAGGDMPDCRRSEYWPDAPHRNDASSERFSISCSPTVYELLRRAAVFVGISEPRFAVGAALRYVSNLKKARPDNAQLAALPLPSQYE